MERLGLWNSLGQLAATNGPWLVGGDFNIVRRADERLGGREIDYAAAADFNDCITSCRLLEPSFVGSKYTCQKGTQRFWQRLDRYLCNSEWLNSFNSIQITHLNRDQSNHAPLLGSFDNSVGSGGQCFKFQNMWIKHHKFLHVVHDSWSQSIEGSPLHVFAAKLNRLKGVLVIWNKEKFGNTFANIIKAENALQDAEIRLETANSEEAANAVDSAKANLNFMLECEDVFWKQRAKVKWLKEGIRILNSFM